jgi:hypothetical protein
MNIRQRNSLLARFVKQQEEVLSTLGRAQQRARERVQPNALAERRRQPVNNRSIQNVEHNANVMSKIAHIIRLLKDFNNSKKQYIVHLAEGLETRLKIRVPTRHRSNNGNRRQTNN